MSGKNWEGHSRRQDSRSKERQGDGNTQALLGVIHRVYVYLQEGPRAAKILFPPSLSLSPRLFSTPEDVGKTEGPQPETETSEEAGCNAAGDSL